MNVIISTLTALSGVLRYRSTMYRMRCRSMSSLSLGYMSRMNSGSSSVSSSRRAMPAWFSLAATCRTLYLQPSCTQHMNHEDIMRGVKMFQKISVSNKCCFFFYFLFFCESGKIKRITVSTKILGRTTVFNTNNNQKY